MPRGRSETKQEKSRRGKRRHDLRERARRAIEDLACVMDQLPKLSEHPERDYAMIFEDESRYFRMLDACNEAYKTSYKSLRKLAKEENWSPLKQALLNAGIFASDKEMFNPERRSALAKRLRSKGKRAGIDYMEHLRLAVLAQEHMPKPKWTATCPRCHLEQFPTTLIDPCPKCGYKGAVIPDLYMP